MHTTHESRDPNEGSGEQAGGSTAAAPVPGEVAAATGVAA